MAYTITCLHCGKTVPRNPRLKKKQKYCSTKECQQFGHNARKKKRYREDRVYRKKHLEKQKAWRKQRPAHQYQREYRKTHPEYVKRNRELQRERSKRRQKEIGSIIVNGTSLSLQPNNDEAYAIFKVKNEKIVNGTSFIAQMKILSMKEKILVENSI